MRQGLAAVRVQYIIAVVLYGTIGLFLRSVRLPSELVAFCRGAVGSLIILGYQKARGGRPDREAIRNNLQWLLLSGVCLGLNWIFLFAAYMRTTVAIASLCNYMAPMAVVLVAPVLLKEPLDRRRLPFALMALAGIVLVSGVLNGGAGEPAGMLLGLAAAACFAALILCNRRMKDIPAMDKSVVQLAVSAATILPYVLARNLGAALSFDRQSVLIVLMLCVVQTGLAYCLYFNGMGALPVQEIAVLGYLEPAVSVLCSALFLREAMAPAGWLGAALIIGAAVASELTGRDAAV